MSISKAQLRGTSPNNCVLQHTLAPFVMPNFAWKNRKTITSVRSMACQLKGSGLQVCALFRGVTTKVILHQFSCPTNITKYYLGSYCPVRRDCFEFILKTHTLSAMYSWHYIQASNSWHYIHCLTYQTQVYCPTCIIQHLFQWDMNFTRYQYVSRHSSDHYPVVLTCDFKNPTILFSPLLHSPRDLLLIQILHCAIINISASLSIPHLSLCLKYMKH